MTNGEKFQQIFAVSQVDECDLNVYAWLPCHDAIEIPLEWWNTNYSEIPTGSTTKNDLGVDAVSRDAVLDLVADYDLSMGQVVKGIHALPSVTPHEPKIVPIAEIKYDEDKLKDLVNKAVLTVTPQEPRKGHWIPTYGNVKCSECGSVKDSREVGKATHYCDFCGAKMVEPQESEEESERGNDK